MKYCIFTIIKDEQEYLDEWIQYHLNLGINKILIFEDTNSASHKDICKKYKNSKIELIRIEQIYKKEYRQQIIEDRKSICLQVYFMKTILDYVKRWFDFDWVFYLDTDEFLTFENNNYNLDNIFSEFNDKQVLVLQWQNYNANGHIYKPNGNVLDNYTTKCNFLQYDIKRTNISKEAFNMHLYDKENMKFNHHKPSKANWCKTNGSTDLYEYVYDKLYVRHYITKSFEDYINKLYIRGETAKTRVFEQFFELNPEIDINNEDVQLLINKYKTYIKD